MCVVVTATRQAAALYVFVTTASMGVFEPSNGFHLLPGESRTLKFTAWDEFDVVPDLFGQSLHAHWLNQQVGSVATVTLSN